MPINKLILLSVTDKYIPVGETEPKNFTRFWSDANFTISNMRTNEIDERCLDQSNCDYKAVYSTKDLNKFNAVMGIIQTFMVCFVLSAGAGMFSKLSNELVIHPIENMIEKVNNISNDPLKAANEEEERLLLEEFEAMNLNAEGNKIDEDMLNKFK